MKTKRYDYKRGQKCTICGNDEYIREVEGKDFCGYCGGFQPEKKPEPAKETVKPVAKKKAPARKPVAKPKAKE